MPTPSSDIPTIVFVHGSFADSSGWGAAIAALQVEGYTTLACANPLRGLFSDAAYVSSILATIEGPIVLVAHSYGGAVITNAATGNDNVTALVYINGFALEEGELLVQALELGGGHSALAEHVVVRPYPGAPEGDADGYINPDAFRELFCADLSEADAAVLSATQRPAALQTLQTPSGVPAWKTIPTWYLASTHDKTIPVEAERAMAARANATFVEIASSHVAMISHPDEVIALVLEAVRATRPAAVIS
jgi:pimeloyl-ACP methyl ester carboxylesterase